jgi:RNA polymerase sigma-70 factor, ECF subfamily
MGSTEIQWQDRSHFFRVAATVMRRILVDDARSRKADKRGGDRVKLPMEDFLVPTEQSMDLIIDVDAALTNLAAIDERQAKVVELRFFGGLSEDEVASCLEISTRTVKREWAMAKAWLKGELA